MTEVADINIRELASLAGVSIATVSRVINNPQLVQPDTREHVLEVMRRVNYAPAWTVESRLSSRSRLIAFLFSEADYYFYSDIRSGLESIAGLRGYTVLFCPIAAEQQRRSQQLRTIFEQKLDGAIWALRDFYPEDIKMIDERQVPLVLARKYDSAPTDRYNCCYINFAEASYRMTRHLLEMGHRRIGLMFENVSQQFMNSFCQGWELALKEEAAPREASLLLNAPNSMAGGYAKTMELLDAGEMRTVFADGRMILVALGLIVISTVLPYLLYTNGLARVESGKASILASLEPVVASFVGILAFGEPMSLTVFLGLGCILACVYVLR